MGIYPEQIHYSSPRLHVQLHLTVKTPPVFWNSTLASITYAPFLKATSLEAQFSLLCLPAAGHISGSAWRGQLEKGPADKSTCCVHWQHLRDDVQKRTREPSLTNTPPTWISKCCFWCVPRVMNLGTQMLTAGNIQAHQGCRLFFQRS